MRLKTLPSIGASNFDLANSNSSSFTLALICEISDSISEGDVFRSYMFNNQCWSLFNYTVNSNFAVPNHFSKKSKWNENSKLKQSQYITSRWPIVNNENKKKEWFDRTFVKLSVMEISMFIHKILIPQLIVKKEVVLEIVEKCKKMGLDDTSIIKFYTISLTKIKNLKKKTKEKIKNIFQE